MGLIADTLGILGAVFCLVILLKLEKKERRQNQTTRVILRSERQRKELPVTIRCAELTRSEVFEYIGMVPRKRENKAARFSLGYISEPEFFRRLNEIAISNGYSVLEIPCTDDELDQFGFA